MDPASVAFGVVSLAIQLVQTTAAIKKLIANYKSATKELEALSNKLDDVETVCHSLEMVLGNFDDVKKPFEIALLDKLNKIIRDCYDKVSCVHDVISKIIHGHEQRPSPFRTIGARFLKYQAQIRRCSTDLDQSISSLQLHMTANLLAINLRPWAKPPEAHNPTTAQSSSKSQNKSSTCAEQAWMPRQSTNRWMVSIKQRRWEWMRLAYLEKRQMRMEAASFGAPVSSTIQDDLIFFAGVPLFDLYIQLSIRRGFLSPLSISFELPCIVNVYRGASDVGDKLWGTMMSDNVEAFKMLLSQRLLTPSTMVIYGYRSPMDSEMSLYGFATLQRANTISEFLIQHTPDLMQRNHISRAPGFYRHSSDCRVALKYFELRGGSLSPSEFTAVLNGARDVDYVQSCTALCKSYFSGDWQPFNLCVWSHVVQTFLDREPGPSQTFLNKQWAPVVREVISSGIDLHTTTWPTSAILWQGHSALQQVFESTDDPDVALQHIDSWVGLLEQAGVEIQHYLDAEIEGCAETLLKSYHEKGFSSYGGFFVAREVSGRQLPYWIETIDDTCPIRDLLTEFPQFKREGFRGSRQIPLTYKGSHRHRAWKDPIAIGFYHTGFSSWPVFPPLCRKDADDSRFGRLLSESEKQEIEGLDRACDLMESRFKRKQVRKLRKAGRTSRRHMNSAIPGAWVD